MKCAPPFPVQGFPIVLVTYPNTVVLETLIDNVKLNFFTCLFCGIITHILTAVSIIFLTQSAKKRPSTPFVCLLRSLLLTTCSVIVETSSAIRHFFFLTD